VARKWLEIRRINGSSDTGWLAYSFADIASGRRNHLQSDAVSEQWLKVKFPWR
jgi:hypothetical protein